MPDPTPTPPAPKPSATPGPLNKAQILALSRTEEIAAAAQKPEYLAQLPAEGSDIDAAFIDTLLADCKAARDQSSGAAQKTVDRNIAAGQEDTAGDQLVQAIQKVQARARQKYARSATPQKLQDFLIGQRISSSSASLKQSAQTIVTLLGSDTLPRIPATFAATITGLVTAWEGENKNQGDAQSLATQMRNQRGQMLQSITDRRLEIQFAADAEWPYTDPANHAIRMEFKLTANRPFEG